MKERKINTEVPSTTAYTGDIIAVRMSKISVDYDVLTIISDTGDTLYFTVKQNGNCDGYVGWKSDTRGYPIEDEEYEVDIVNTPRGKKLNGLIRIG